ncbi:hypothetical protein MRX96_024310 [Rhipicephalus microplus]
MNPLRGGSEITSGARLKERFGMSETGPDSPWPDETVRHIGFCGAAAVTLVDPASSTHLVPRVSWRRPPRVGDALHRLPPRRLSLELGVEA